MSEEQIERLAQLADSLDTALFPLRLNMPDKIKIEGMSGIVRDVRDEIAALVREMGQDPWDGEPFEG